LRLEREAPRPPPAIISASMPLCKRWHAATAFAGCRRSQSRILAALLATVPSTDRNDCMALPRAPPIPNPAGKRAEKCLSISSVKAARQGLHPPALLFATRSPVQTEDTTRTKLRPEQAVRDPATLPLNRAAPRAPRAI